MRPDAPTIGYLTCLAWMTVVGLAYTMMSPGLAAYTPDGPFFCHGLLSSGSEDDAMISAFALFMLPLTLRLALIRRNVTWVELPVFSLCLFMVLLALWLAGLDCADVFYTAFLLPDPALAGALIALPGSAVMLMVLWLNR